MRGSAVSAWTTLTLLWWLNLLGPISVEAPKPHQQAENN